MLELTDTELVWIIETLKMDANERHYLEKWCETILSEDEVNDLLVKLGDERLKLEKR